MHYYLLTGINATGDIAQHCIEIDADAREFDRPIACPTREDRPSFWGRYLQGLDIQRVSSVKRLAGLVTYRGLPQ